MTGGPHIVNMFNQPGFIGPRMSKKFPGFTLQILCPQQGVPTENSKAFKCELAMWYIGWSSCTFSILTIYHTWWCKLYTTIYIYINIHYYSYQASIYIYSIYIPQYISYIPIYHVMQRKPNQNLKRFARVEVVVGPSKELVFINDHATGTDKNWRYLPYIFGLIFRPM